MAVLDRIVDDTFAVFLLSPGEVEWVARLPGARGALLTLPKLVAAEGLDPGTWGRLMPLSADGQAGHRETASPVYVFRADDAATEAARARIAAQLDALRSKRQRPGPPPGSGVTAVPAGASEPTWTRRGIGPPLWPCGPLRPIPACPRPRPF